MKSFLAVALAFVCIGAAAQAAVPTQRLRGTVESIEGSTLVLKERNGETMHMTLADNFSVSEVVPIPISSLQPGNFVGTAALSDTGGKLRALEVLVLPEAARGSGEGHYPWDLAPGSTMTNGTVTEMVVAANGRTLKLRYKDGEQTIVVPDDVPIVTFKPGDRSLIVAGAKVLVTAQMRDGKLVALRALAGRGGFAPPM
jgi:hypothetical protein